MTTTYNGRPVHASPAGPARPYSTRPASIQELAEKALNNSWEPSQDFKQGLRMAERARNNGKEYIKKGDLESAFVQYAKAATLILDKIPAHREYLTRLTIEQRQSLTLNGQDLLNDLTDLKSTITQRHNIWCNAHPEADTTPTRSQNDSGKPGIGAERAPARSFNPANESRGEDPRQGMNRWPAMEPDGRPFQDARRADAMSRSQAEKAKIAQRQRDADMEARVARQGGPSRPLPIVSQMSRSSTQDSEFILNPLPLESPYRGYDTESSTDTESNADARLARQFARLEVQERQQQQQTPGRPMFGAYVHPSQYRPDANGSWSPSNSRVSYPPPITTTTPMPSVIEYPQLMSQHQRTQGYAPSLQSAFMMSQSDAPSRSLLFEQEPSSSHYALSMPPAAREQAYPPHISYPGLPVTNSGYPPFERPEPPHPPPAQPPPIPRSTRPPEPQPPRILPAPGKRDPVSKELKTVYLPRETLTRFLDIAAANTARNRETCGLLLGKPKGEKYVVSTLLIPRQHSTSDTCTMDEEELVLAFTEQRNLITLGWIHTHPSQSCFMSSVDLHTHSGFQRMLDESFAVVCAPKSTPNFGIFRLTDPPGLQTILKCDAKEAFHPHPDLPIYTDADKGHVLMKDIPLEIVDIR